MVEVLRRYSRRGDLWRHATKMNLQLARGDTRPAATPVRGGQPAHRVDVRLGSDQIAQIVADYEAGTETAELQLRYGLSKGSVRKLLTDAGAAPHRRPLSDDEIHACSRLYAGGMTIREVAAKRGLPKTTVQDALRRLGVESRPARRRSTTTSGHRHV